MSMIFGWCQGSGHHDSCRKETGTTTGILRCGCPCHDGDSPSGEGESGSGKRRESRVSADRIGGQMNGPGIAEFAPLAGALTTTKESPDA